MALSIAGFEVALPVLTLGVITGMTYGILAVGLVLIYRSNRIINFAHGEIGAFGGTLLAIAVVRWGFPYWAAFPLAVGASGALGGLTEIAVVRRLRRAPALMSLVATLGVAELLSAVSLVMNAQVRAGYIYPQPSGLPEFDVGALRVTHAYSGMLFGVPLVVVALAVFLRRSRHGLAIRASAENPDVARMSAIFAGRMSTLSWVLAGGLSAITAVLIFPTRSAGTGQVLGPGLLMRALAGAVVARMTNLPVALVAGIGLGVVEQELLWNYPRGGFVEAVLFVVVVAALLAQMRTGSREQERGSWATVQPWPPLPEAFLRVWTIRNLGRILAAVALMLAVVIAIVASNSTAILLVAILGYTLVGLSIGIVTGLGGQLSLGQFALAGIGATASYAITHEIGNFLAGFAGAGLAAAIVSALIGLPALRIRGLMLAVTTLSFALAAEAWLFQQPWALSDGVAPGRPILGSVAIDSGRKYYAFTLVFLVFGFWLARNVWAGGLRRRLVALRDNEDGARAFTVPATRVKLQAFALSGFLAGVGGAVYGHALARIASATFPVGASVNVVAMTVLGGIGILAGPLVGALYIIGVPQFVPLDSAGLAATSFGWLLLILYFPGGIAQLCRPLRERTADALARLSGVDPAAARAGTATTETPAPVLAAAARPVGAGVMLAATGLRKRFGGVRAVDGVDLEVRTGETLGLIGPNGAGKTTLFELIGGFTKPDEGRVVFDGRDIGRLGPEHRGRLGLIRSFQDASLFPTMTVLDAVMLSLERSEPTRFLAAVAGLNGSERRKDARARELVDLMGLAPWRNRQIRELSTGTRRIAELACLVALAPKLLLLDEPSSGIAQRETEALRGVLENLKAHLDATLIVIEHDIPLVMALSDRIVAMESGKIIATGTPAEIRNDPAVIESYLGVDPRAIERSEVQR
jgi:ABC-type branched-subunit amino acid transport system ATPase component/branched-subunit amino acid ABC-type transport system permease component